MKLQEKGTYPMTAALYMHMVLSEDFIHQRFEEFATPDDVSVDVMTTAPGSVFSEPAAEPSPQSCEQGSEQSSEESDKSRTEGTPTSAQVKVRAQMRTEALPEQARSFIGSNTQLTYTENWDFASFPTTLRATCELRFDALPATASFTMTLHEDAGECSCEVEGEVAVTIPFLGRMVENLIVEHLGEFFAHDVRLAAQWAASHERNVLVSPGE